MLHFTVFHNNEPIKTYEFDSEIITIGRLPENDIPIASISVSRRHIRIEQDAAHQYILTDLNSLNGTFVNNKRMSKTKLSDSDKISIGKYSILFEIVTENNESNEATAFKTQEGNALADGTDVSEMEVKNDDIDALKSHISKVADINTPVLLETNKHITYKLDDPVMSIGNSERADIFVEGFLIGDEHVFIEKNEEGTWIYANKLMGRFKINGKKVNKHKLKHKDRIEIGKSTFRYMENGQKQ